MTLLIVLVVLEKNGLIIPAWSMGIAYCMILLQVLAAMSKLFFNQ